MVTEQSGPATCLGGPVYKPQVTSCVAWGFSSWYSVLPTVG